MKENKIPPISDTLNSAEEALKERIDGPKGALKPHDEELNRKILELNSLSNYLHTILSTISQGIIFIDLGGKITTYNHAAEFILKKPLNEVILRPFSSIFPDSLFGFSMEQALESKTAPKMALVTLQDEKGQAKEIEVETTFVLQRPDHVKTAPLQGLILCIRDATEFRNLEKEAHRKSRLNDLGEMVSIIAHELRNPLGGIKGFASLLERDLKERPDLAKMASYIVKGAENLNELVTRALNYSRPLSIQPRTTDLYVLIEELKIHVQNDPALNKKIRFQIHGQKQKLNAPVDPYFLKSALLNLIVNAVQATPERGSIDIHLSGTDHEAVIMVEDTGVGIAPENIKKIFSPFFTTRADGNGLGLSEVYKVIQAHEGSIDVESVLDKGTKFTIKLPLKGKN